MKKLSYDFTQKAIDQIDAFIERSPFLQAWLQKTVIFFSYIFLLILTFRTC